MGHLFSELNKVAEQQREEAQGLVEVGAQPSSEDRKPAQKVAQKPAQKSEQVSKPLLTPLNKTLHKTLSGDAIEDLAYRLRKVPKTKLNTEVPEAWKKKLDSLVVDLGVGKYDLVMYIIALFLGEVGEDKDHP